LEIVRFVITGGVCFVVDYGCMVMLKELVGLSYFIASGISFCLSVILNYILCVIWTFQGVDRGNKKAMVTFFITSVIGLGLNQLFMWMFVELAYIHYTIAKVITAGLVMAWNYFTKRKALINGKPEGLCDENCDTDTVL